MIAIIVSIAISLSILLSAFVSFSPNFKSLVEADLRRKAEESAWSYAAKSGQLIGRASSLNNPPGGLNCTGILSNWTCKETLPLRRNGQDDGLGGMNWVGQDHVCVEISGNLTHTSVDNVTPSQSPCP